MNALAIVVAVLAAGVLAVLVARLSSPRDARRTATEAAVPTVAPRGEVARRVAELEGEVAALRTRVIEVEGSTGVQLRRLWGAVSVERRADRAAQATAAEQLTLAPLSGDQELRPLTPELLAHLQGNGAVAESENAPAAPPRRVARRW